MQPRSIIVFVAAFLISHCTILRPASVTFQGTSMLPSVHNGDKLKVQWLNSATRPQLVRGDIVVFRFPLDQTKSYIKRVIGLPGEKIEFKSGEVWCNGVKLEEPYINPQMNLSRRAQPPTTVPAHAYFVLGDNRDNSSDSRIWGTVEEDLIDAK